jgi:hypothetical protein
MIAPPCVQLIINKRIVVCLRNHGLAFEGNLQPTKKLLFRFAEVLVFEFLSGGGRDLNEVLHGTYSSHGDSNDARCEDAPDYLASFSHIQAADIPKGADRPVYHRFLG